MMENIFKIEVTEIGPGDNNWSRNIPSGGILW
jgi:hypothetical protein